MGADYLGKHIRETFKNILFLECGSGYTGEHIKTHPTLQEMSFFICKYTSLKLIF